MDNKNILKNNYPLLFSKDHSTARITLIENENHLTIVAIIKKFSIIAPFELREVNVRDVQKEILNITTKKLCCVK